LEKCLESFEALDCQAIGDKMAQPILRETQTQLVKRFMNSAF